MKAIVNDILRVNQEFYEAFSSSNLVMMRSVWADSNEIVCIHPGWSPLSGLESVMASWDTIFRAQEQFEIRAVGVDVRISDSLAFVICGESVNREEATLIATNTFRRTEYGWKLLHHHASPILSDESFDSLISEDIAESEDDSLLH